MRSYFGNIASKRRGGGGFDWSWATVQSEFLAGLSSKSITANNQVIIGTLPNLPDNGWMTYGWEGGTLMADGQHVLLINAEDQSGNYLTKYDTASLDVVKTWPTTKGSMRTHLLKTGQILIWPKNGKGPTLRIMDPDTEVWTDVNGVVNEISSGRGNFSYIAGQSSCLLSDGLTLLFKVNYPVGHADAGRPGAWALLNTQTMEIEYRDPTKAYSWPHKTMSCFGELADGRVIAIIRDDDDDASSWLGYRYCIYDFDTNEWTTYWNAYGNEPGASYGRFRPNWFNPNELVHPWSRDDNGVVVNIETPGFTTLSRGSIIFSVDALPNGDMWMVHGPGMYGAVRFSNLIYPRWTEANATYCYPGKLVQTITGNAVQINTASGYRQVCYSNYFNDHTIPLNALTSPWVNSL